MKSHREQRVSLMILVLGGSALLMGCPDDSTPTPTAPTDTGAPDTDDTGTAPSTDTSGPDTGSATDDDSTEKTPGPQIWYADADGDGFGDPDSWLESTAQPLGYVADAADCHDDEHTAYPGSTETETPGDGIDTDCDGLDRCTDMTCDGQPDLVLPIYRDSMASKPYRTQSRIVPSDGRSFDTTNSDGFPTIGVSDLVVIDLNDDGYQDIVYATETDIWGGRGAAPSYIVWGSADVYALADITYLPSMVARDVHIADLDADGFYDIVLTNYHDGEASYANPSYVYWGSTSGYSTSDRTSLSNTGAVKAASGDFDGDGFQDLVFCNRYDGIGGYELNSRVYPGSASGFGSAIKLPTNQCEDVETADLDRDGVDDIIFANSSGGQASIYWGQLGGMSSENRQDLATNRGVDVIVADVNQDGLEDLTFVGNSMSTTDGQTYTYTNSVNGFSSSPSTIVDCAYTKEGTVEDLDGDGYPELLLGSYWNGSSDETDIHTQSMVYWGGASGYSSANRTVLDTENTYALTPADIDGDGYLDIIAPGYDREIVTRSFVYWGSASGYSSSDRDDLGIEGVYPRAVVVGD